MAHRVVVLGTGPAGLASALYLSRANLPPRVFEGMQPGGQLTITTDVDNYPGFPEGIMGPELMDRMKQQCARFGTTFTMDEIVEVDLSSRPFKIKPSFEPELEADALIISTGASARWLGLPNEKRLQGHGVSACATCDGFFFQKQHVIVVGGGDSACEEASFLTKFASKVTMIHRRDELRASKIMQQRVLDDPKIEILWSHGVTDVIGESSVTGVEVEDHKTGEKRVIEATGLFLAIGHVPNTAPFKGLLEMDDAGYLVTRAGSTFTNVEGVFAAGDVQDTVYRQAVTAAGSGCQAALDCERWLEGVEWPADAP